MSEQIGDMAGDAVGVAIERAAQYGTETFVETIINTGAQMTGNPLIMNAAAVSAPYIASSIASTTTGTAKPLINKIGEKAGDAVEYMVDPILAPLTEKGKEFMTDICIGGVVEALGYEKKKAPYISMLFRMIRNTPKQTGIYIDDYVKWSEFVDKYVGEFESMSGQTIDMYITEDHIKSFENITKKDGQFLRKREEIIYILKEMRSFRGLVENFLANPIKNFRDHSVTLTDRFNEFLPQWINDIGLGDIGIRLIGDVKSQPAMSEKSLKIIGFAYYDPSEEYTNAKSRLSENPFEKFVGNPQGVDKFGNKYHYRYFGPNNPLPNGKPLNIIDKLAEDHDYSYRKYGYNTDGAREADRVLVQGLKRGIESGDITEDSPYDELDYAKKGIQYFSYIQQK